MPAISSAHSRPTYLAQLLKPGENELFVLADNRFNQTTAPMHTGGDFWHYGGLTRSVELHIMASSSKPALWRAYVLPTGSGPSNPVAKPDAVDITLVLTDNTVSGAPMEWPNQKRELRET
eukprot:SAG11_NODE_985_length_6288_cov_53.468972_4_plen_120_part_00